MSEQEYLYNNEYVTIYRVLPDEDDMVIVSNDHGELIVASFSSMERKEDSYYFVKAEERKQELEAITKKAKDNLDKLVDKLIDKSIIALSSRIKFNVAFGEGGSAAPYALMLSQELQKMIKEKAPEVIKEKEEAFV